METSDQIASHIVSLIDSSKNREATGAQLSALLRHKFSDFSPPLHGCANLRDFIRRFVPDAIETGRAGADIIYGIRGSKETAQPSAQEPGPRIPVPGSSAFRANIKPEIQVDLRVWKTFASPASQFRLYGNAESGILCVVPPGGAPLEAPWVHIPSCPPETHRQIAEEFVKMLPEESHRVALTQTFGYPSSWWTAYYSVIQQLGLTSVWNPYRRRRILRELESSLEQRGVSTAHIEAASVSHRRAGGAVSDRPSVVAAAQDSLLRSLAIDVVRNMATAELRALWVPLGCVVDALALKHG